MIRSVEQSTQDVNPLQFWNCPGYPYLSKTRLIPSRPRLRSSIGGPNERLHRQK